MPRLKHGRRAGVGPSAVGDQREVHFDDFCASGFQRLARIFPEGDHGLAGMDALTGRAADTGLSLRPPVHPVDKHARHNRGACLEGTVLAASSR